jgi:hypothetical protein
MKHKAKPAKGSARTKRFDVGGTVGALAGLGTLAYLMSRKKKGETGKVDEAAKRRAMAASAGRPEMGDATNDNIVDTTPKVDEAAKRRAMAASAGRPEMGDATNDNIVVNESAPPKRNTTTPVVKKDKPPKTPTPTVEGFTEPGLGHAKEIKDKFAKFDRDPNKGKYQNTRADAIRGALPGKKPYTDSSGVVYNERGEPYANTTAKAGATPKKPADKKPADKKPADKKQEAATGAKRTRYAKKKVEEPKRNTKPKRTRYAKKQVTDKKYSSGGSVSSASKRADGCAIRGKTRA